MADAVTEHEIQRGMLQSPDPASTSFCITRCITNLTDNLHRSRARKFTDIVTGGDTDTVDVDVTAQQMLAALRDTKIAGVLEPESIANFDIYWKHPEATNPNEDELYLRQFMDVFETKMLELIEHAVARQRSVACNSHVVEILQHLTVCAQRSQVRLTVKFSPITLTVICMCRLMHISVCIVVPSVCL